MSAGVLLVAVVVVAYLATHVVYDWVARRLLIVSGAEYLVLGMLLGPQATGLVSADVVKGFAPLAALTVGWMGVLIGMQFHLPTLVRVPGLTFRLAFAEALATLTGVSAASFFLIRPLFALTPVEAAGPALALGAIACASTPAGLELAARLLDERATSGPPGARRERSLVRARLLRQLQHSIAVDALVAVVAIGLLAGWAHPVVEGIARQPTMTEWVAITLGIGVGGGILFHLFLGAERHPDRLFVALAGAVILASGTATFLRLSPLLACVIVGAILVNTSSSRAEIGAVLRGAERPLYYVLLIFAGMAWKPSAQAAWLLPVVVFLAVRTAIKIGAPQVATWWNRALPSLGGRWGRALVGQGGLAIALAFDYLLRRDVMLPNVVFTAAVVSVLLTEFAAVRLVRAAIEPAVEPVRSLIHRATRGARVRRAAPQGEG